MKSFENQKKELFKDILYSIDKTHKVSTTQEAMLVSLCFEKTFAVMTSLFNAELRNNYIKKSKPKINKTKDSRLQSIK